MIDDYYNFWKTEKRIDSYYLPPKPVQPPLMPLVPGESINPQTNHIYADLIKKTDTAIKHDSGKRDWSLLPYDSLEEVVKVLEFGAKKYSRDNWKAGEGFKYTRSFNALQRHMLAFMRGEDNDPETGISHLSHAMCNLLFMQYFVLNKDKYKNCDDR